MVIETDLLNKLRQLDVMWICGRVIHYTKTVAVPQHHVRLEEKFSGLTPDEATIQNHDRPAQC